MSATSMRDAAVAAAAARRAACRRPAWRRARCATRLPSARASRSRSAGDRRQVRRQVRLDARPRPARGAVAGRAPARPPRSTSVGADARLRHARELAELVDDPRAASAARRGWCRSTRGTARANAAAAAPSLGSSARRSVSIESWIGKIGFFSSWARRRAISRQAATRSACSRRSREVLELARSGP